jgi:hypothetical protein
MSSRNGPYLLGLQGFLIDDLLLLVENLLHLGQLAADVHHSQILKHLLPKKVQYSTV